MHPTYGNVEHIDINVSPRRSAISLRPEGGLHPGCHKNSPESVGQTISKPFDRCRCFKYQKGKLKLRTYWNLATSSLFFFRMLNFVSVPWISIWKTMSHIEANAIRAVATRRILSESSSMTPRAAAAAGDFPIKTVLKCAPLSAPRKGLIKTEAIRLHTPMCLCVRQNSHRCHGIVAFPYPNTALELQNGRTTTNDNEITKKTNKKEEKRIYRTTPWPNRIYFKNNTGKNYLLAARNLQFDPSKSFEIDSGQRIDTKYRQKKPSPHIFTVFG